MRHIPHVIRAGIVMLPVLAALPGGCSGKVALGPGVCKTDSDCSPSGRCVDGECWKPLKVGAILVDHQTKDWSRGKAFADSLREAVDATSNVDLRIAEGLFGDPVMAEVDKMVAEGRELIIFDSFDHRTQAQAAAQKYWPKVKFLAYSGRPSPTWDNLGAYALRLEQAWYVAGQVATYDGASGRDRLGFIGSFVTPEVVRHINAFTLGAQSVRPTVKVEVRWLGFYYDYNTSRTFKYSPRFLGASTQDAAWFAEEYAAALLIDGGAEVIAHQSANPRANNLIEVNDGKMFEPGTNTPRRVLSIASDHRRGWRNVETGNGTKTVMGSVYWNWGPFFKDVFEDMMRGVPMPMDFEDGLAEDPGKSLFGFEANGLVIEESAAEAWRVNTAKKPYTTVFAGPYETTGQRAPVAVGETLSDKELRQMCWFVKGVVEKVNPMDPTSADQDALVPTTAHPAPSEEHPQAGTHVLLPAAPGVPRGIGWSCDENQIPE